MKNYLKLGITCLFFVFLSTFSLSNNLETAVAYTLPVGHLPVQVSASIGQYYINVSGFIAPFASVVLTSDNVVLRSVAADARGYFSMSQILVKQGFSHFCFTAIDVKRLGESDACFTIPQVTGNYTKANIFLPPTIGLFRTQITAGGNALIWGYSMPGALVAIHGINGTTYIATADKTGYYEVNVAVKDAGSYDLSATATLNSPAGEQKSEVPTNTVNLIALTLAQQTNQTVSNWLKNLLTFLFNLPLGPLWLAIPLIILIFILTRKLRGQSLLPKIGNPMDKEKLFFDYLFRNRKLHHSWIKGVGY